MLDNSSNRFAGIFAEVKSEGISFASVLIEKSKTTLVLKEQIKSATTYADFKLFGDKTIPVSLVLNGKGIIHKKLHRTSSDSPASLLNKALPNASPADFYAQIVPLDDHEVWVSVVRKEVANAIVDDFAKQKVFITHLSLGPFIINSILPLIDASENLEFANYRLELNEEKITNLITLDSFQNVTIHVADEKLDSSALIPYAAAFALAMNIQDVLAESESVNAIKGEFDQKKKFLRNRWLVAGIFFVLSMINLVLFNKYRSSYSNLSEQIAIHESTIAEFDSLKSDYDSKKKFAEQTGLADQSRHSWYADQLAITTPATVKLTLLNIHPSQVKTNNQNETEIKFAQKSILVSGMCSKSTDLNDWIKTVKQFKWVKDVSLKTYAREKAMESAEFNFEIALQ